MTMTLNDLWNYAALGAGMKGHFRDYEEILAYQDQWFDLHNTELEDIWLTKLQTQDPDFSCVTGCKC